MHADWQPPKAGEQVTAQLEHFRIESDERSDGTIVLNVSGEADVESAPSLRRMLAEAADREPFAIVLDLNGLEFIDSSGISVLVEAQLRAAREGWRLTLRNVPRQAVRVLTIAGLTSKFTIV